MNNNKALTAALEYANNGFSVFPVHKVDDKGVCSCYRGESCPSSGKHPVLKGWPKKATRDSEQIKHWWGSAFKGYNIGLLTGTGVLVIDLDVSEDKGKDGRENLKLLEDRLGELPETVEAITGSQTGRHLFFRYDPEIFIPKKSTKNVESDWFGIDVQAGEVSENAYSSAFVVVEPSVSGKGAYRFVNGIPTMDDIALLPEAWIQELAGASPEAIKVGRRDGVHDYQKTMASLPKIDPDMLSATDTAYFDMQCALSWLPSDGDIEQSDMSCSWFKLLSGAKEGLNDQRGLKMIQAWSSATNFFDKQSDSYHGQHRVAWEFGRSSDAGSASRATVMKAASLFGFDPARPCPKHWTIDEDGEITIEYRVVTIQDAQLPQPEDCVYAQLPDHLKVVEVTAPIVQPDDPTNIFDSLKTPTPDIVVEDCLPPVFLNCLHDCVDIMQCTPEMVAGLMMVYGSFCVQGNARVRWPGSGNHFIERLTNLFFICVAETGERKSSLNKLFSKVITNWDRKQREAFEYRKKEASLDFELWESKRKKLKSAHEKAKEEEDVAAAYEELKEHEKNRPYIPALRKGYLGNGTMQGQAAQLLQYRSMIMVNEEAAEVVAGHSARNESDSFVARLNRIWDGEIGSLINVLGDKEKSTDVIQEHAQSICLMMQQVIYEVMLENFGIVARETGHWSRYLMIRPRTVQHDNKPKRSDLEPAQESKINAGLDNFRSIMEKLLDMQAFTEKDYMFPVPIIQPDASARDVLHQVNLKAKELSQEFVGDNALKGAADKFAEKVMKYACVFRVFRALDAQSTLESIEIEEQDMWYAFNFGLWDFECFKHMMQTTYKADSVEMIAQQIFTKALRAVEKGSSKAVDGKRITFEGITKMKINPLPDGSKVTTALRRQAVELLDELNLVRLQYSEDLDAKNRRKIQWILFESPECGDGCGASSSGGDRGIESGEHLVKVTGASVSESGAVELDLSVEGTCQTFKERFPVKHELVAVQSLHKRRLLDLVSRLGFESSPASVDGLVACSGRMPVQVSTTGDLSLG